MYIGSTNIVNSPFSVWTDNRTEYEIRQNERLLFSRIHLITAYLNNMPVDDPQRDILLNMLSVYYIELQLIKDFGVTPEYLYRAGVILSNYVGEIMNRTFDSENERNSFILNVISDIKRKTVNGTSSVADIDFMADWIRDVYDQNYFIDFSTGTKTQTHPSFQIGSPDSGLTQEFIKTAPNLVYTVVPYATMTTAEAKRKRVLQNAVISGLCGSGYGFTDAICTNYIRSSIVNGTNGLSPEQYVEGMKQIAQEGESKVGELTVAAATLIVGLVSAALTTGARIFINIYNARKNSQYKDAVSNLKQADDCFANFPDWFKLGDLDGDGKDDTLKVWLGLLGIGAFAYLYTNKK